MGVLTAEMKRVVDEQRLGFVATVCPDGTPNLSPKGTTAVWDDDHLVFANIRSPGTVANLRQNPNVEVNVVDPFVRRGYRFKGVASILESGPLYDQAIAFYRHRGSRNAIAEVVMIRVRTAHRSIRRPTISGCRRTKSAIDGSGTFRRFATGRPAHQQANSWLVSGEVLDGVHQRPARRSPARENQMQHPHLDASPCEAGWPLPDGGRPHHRGSITPIAATDVTHDLA